MNPKHNLLDLLDPKKTTSPITSLPKLSSETCKAFSTISKAPTCSTKSSESPENIFLSLTTKEKLSKAKAPTHSKPRSGDWLCLLCGNHNYSFRETCNRCQKQTKTCNLEQSLRIFNNSNLKSDLMKNETMAKRLDFNFCYSLGSGRQVPLERTLNSNVITPNFAQRFPFSMMNPQFPPISDFYRGQKMQYQARPNFLSGFSGNQIPSNPGFGLQSDFRSKFSDFPQVNEISPMLSFNGNQGFQNFKKGTIKSDICHDKYMSQMNNNQQENMQQNLVEKFKQMNLIPGKNKLEKPASNDKGKSHFANRKKQKNKLKAKENQRPAKAKPKRQKLKQKRRGKIKYKAVESTQMKKNKGVFKATIYSQKTENRPVQPVNTTKSVEELFQTEFSLQREIFPEPEEKSKEYFQEQEEDSSPKKINFGSIFHSKLLFDFETPKKVRNDCFLHGDSMGKDSDLKYEYGFSKQKNKILRLFSQSDDEDEEIMGEKEFSQSIQKMKQTGLGDKIF